MAAAKGNKYACKYNNGKMEKICEQLLDWAENSKSIHFASFCRKVLGKSKKWLRETAEHYPQLAEAIEDAKELIAQKIVDSCFRDKESGVNASFGLQYLPIYDSDFKNLLKWKAEISREQPREPENQCAFNEWKESQKESK